MKRSIFRHALLLVVFLTWCGCDHDCYEIEIQPEGQAFQRRLTCWHIGGEDNKQISPLSAEKRAALAKLYPKRTTPDDAKKQVFSGQFTRKTPNDVGGEGSYTCFTTPLGSTSAYVERFRGDDDLGTQIDKQWTKRREAADQLADLLAGWMTAELGHEPNFPRLKKYLDNDLKQDLRNLAAYSLTFYLAGESQTRSNYEFLVRAGQYFCERGYLSPQQIPTLVRAWSGEDPQPLLSHVQRFLARKMGIADDQPLPASLDFLDTPASLSASCERYVCSSELFRKRNETSKSQKKDKKEKMASTERSPSCEGGKLLCELAFDVVWLPLGIFSEYDSLHVKLHSGEKPYSTNGEWDEKTATVMWDGGVEADVKDRPLPLVCFALWSTPDRAFQEMHFGRILLVGGDLAKYAVWYRALKLEEAKEWDQFLGGLKPDSHLVAKIKAFRFSIDPKADPNKSEQPASLADTPRRLILEALEVKSGSAK